ncbi:tetratricopeptide repeat protein [Paraburkholderia sp. J12]|uniref:tetratricopeptide repeat protein n=1 Tax=Paraburkholderia sp. J12 TaxID=2805432 RepID=UPI002ABE35F6|nr:tetratricopeptide repeat protein [Paraburkholderia sp. J12]
MTIDAELQQAVSLHRTEHYAEAEAIYRSILLSEPGNPDANHNFGLLHLQMGLIPEGIALFRTAVDAAPQRRQLWSSYVDALIMGGQHDEAQLACESARAYGFSLRAAHDDGAQTSLDAHGNDPTASGLASAIKSLLARGQNDKAEAFAKQMTEACPDHELGWKTVAYAHLRRGDLDGALGLLEKAHALCPTDRELGAHLDAARAMRTATALNNAARYEEAVPHYRTVLEAYPDHPAANHALGVIAIRLRQPAAAIPLLEKAIGADPNNLQYWANYIDGLLQNDELKAAWLALEMAQQRGLSGPAIDALINIMTQVSTQQAVKVPKADAQPVSVAAPAIEPATGPVASQSAPQDDAPAARAAIRARPLTKAEENEFQALATIFNQGKIEAALKGGLEVAARYPWHGFPWKVVGISQHRLGRYDEAMANCRKALALMPDDVDALAVLAGLEQMRHELEGAYKNCSHLLEVSPDHGEGLRLMGVIQMELGRLDEAERFGRRAIEVSQAPLAYNSLGVTLMKQGRLDAAAAMFQQAADADPNNAMMYNNLAFCLTHSETVTPAEVFAAHRRFAEHFEVPLKPHWKPHTNSRDPQRQLRIGFISGDFCHHAVASFIEPVLAPLGRDSSLSLHAYSNTAKNDQVTARLRGLFAHWTDVVGMTEDQASERIRADGIDILIDLSGHTAMNRLLALARKPAPIQACWIGYPGTTGLDAVDYFIADRFWVPSDQFRNQFTEKIAYLPALAPFEADRLCPPVNLLPQLHNGYVSFGSFNRLDKLRRDVIALWARILREMPTARMLIGAMPRDGGNGEVAQWFADEGIASDRLDFRPRSSVPVYLQQHHHVDICLDSFPFSGLTTALHSLWMGVPTLTLPSQTVPGRSGLTAMSHVGLLDFIAADKDDYVRRAVALGSDPAKLAALRAGMRERCAQSPMFQPEAVAGGLSRALRVMWRRWCEGLPPESFEVPELPH